jgi:hypothetical protein
MHIVGIWRPRPHAHRDTPWIKIKTLVKVRVSSFSDTTHGLWLLGVSDATGSDCISLRSIPHTLLFSMSSPDEAQDLVVSRGGLLIDERGTGNVAQLENKRAFGPRFIHHVQTWR